MDTFVSLLLVVLAQASAVSCAWNVPFILWSNQLDTSSAQPLYIRDVLSRDTIVNMIATSSSSKLPTAFTRPNVLLLFSYPELRTDEIANMAVVKHQMSNHSPLVIFPHVLETLESNETSSVIECATPTQVITTLEGLPRQEEMVTLVVEIGLNQQGKGRTTEDQMVALIGHLTKDHRHMKILFSITGTKPTLPFQQLHHRMLTKSVFTCPAGYYVNLVNPARPSCFSHFVSITPGILTGILMSLFMIMLACVGFSSLHQIQTPARYASVPPPKGKEF